MRTNRQILTAAITFLAGLYFFLDFILPEKMPESLGGFEFGKYNDQILIGVSTVGVMAIGLGLMNVFSVHGGRIARGQRGWPNSFALLSGLLLMFVVEGWDSLNGERTLNSWKRVSDYAAFAQTLAVSAAQPGAVPGAQTPSVSAAQTPGVGAPVMPPAEGIQALSKEMGALRAEVEANEGYLGRGLADPSLAAERGAVLARLGALQTRGALLVRAFEEPSMKQQLPSMIQAYGDDFKAVVPVMRDAATKIQNGSTVKKASKLLFSGFYTSLSTAMFALLGFYIASAAYRSFRLRSVEAGALMITAILVILGQIPHGPLYISSDLPQLRVWLMENLNTPGNRAIYFASSIAGLALAIRMWLSLERSPLESVAEPRGKSTKS